MLCGNGDHTVNGNRLEKLEEMQGSIVRRRIHTKLIIPVLLWEKMQKYNEIHTVENPTEMNN